MHFKVKVQNISGWKKPPMKPYVKDRSLLLLFVGKEASSSPVGGLVLEERLSRKDSESHLRCPGTLASPPLLLELS